MRKQPDTETIETILWRGLVFPGHESCRLFSAGSEWQLEGTAVFSHEERPCQLDYQIFCDQAWQTLFALVKGWVGKTFIELHIKTHDSRRWWVNRQEQPEVLGCTDIDLNFSPSTNLLPIRRLGLAIGESAEVHAAWLRFPSFKLERLIQTYTRLEENRYRYESAGGQFAAEIQVNASGFVVDYQNLWQVEASSES